jgi:hypothetical protein
MNSDLKTKKVQKGNTRKDWSHLYDNTLIKDKAALRITIALDWQSGCTTSSGRPCEAIVPKVASEAMAGAAK